MRLKFFAAAVAATIAGCAGAQAADLPARMPVKAAPVVQTFNWTGAYVGAHLGYGWSRTTFTDTDPAFPWWSLLNKTDGILGGGQIGYNYQSGAWVLGAEADFSWAAIKGTDFDTGAFAGERYETRTQWTSTLTGRIGYAFDRSLLYVKGGAAFARAKVDYLFPGDPELERGSRTLSGWTIGAGLEYAFAPQWSARLEYNYLDFGKRSVQLVSNAYDWLPEINQNIHVVKAGINFRPW